MIMMMSMKNNVKLVLIDITKAFMESKLKEDIYIEVPKGYSDVLKEENMSDKVIKLNSEVYGLKQASRCFFEHITSFFKNSLHYESFQSDPCLLKSKKGDKCPTICGIYVDDILMCGEEESIKRDIELIKKKFDITVDVDFEDYVGCEVLKKDDMIHIHQKNLIDKLLKDFSLDT